MVSELVVDVQPKEVSIAVLEDKSLVELQKEARNEAFAVGDIYLGKVKKLMPGLNAAFIDIGYKKDAFLHYLDLGPNFNTQQKYLKQLIGDSKKAPAMPKIEPLPELEKNGSINQVLKAGQEVLVQIAKEPISTKGPRLTSELSFAGRFIVLIPFSDKVSVSTKIKSNAERSRLRQLIMSIKPKNFSVIVRTSAEGKRVAELDHELKTLVKRWEDSIAKVPKAKLPSMVYEETARTVALLRDIFNPSFEHIYVNDKEVCNDVRNYVSLISPGKEDIVQEYTGALPIFDNFGITKQIKSLFGRTVTYKSGAYLIIEHTEAMHVIDVNRCPRADGHRRELGGSHRDRSPTAPQRYGRNHRDRLYRHARSKQPTETIRAYVERDEDRQSQAQHTASQQVWTDANHPSTCAPSNGRKHIRELSLLLWDGHRKALHPVYRQFGRENR